MSDDYWHATNPSFANYGMNTVSTQLPIYRNLTGDPELAAKYRQFGWSVPTEGGPGAAGPAYAGAGSVLGTYNPASGGIPTVPNLQASQAQSATGNIGNFDDLANLAGQTNTFNLGQQTAQNRAGLPGYDSLMGQSSGNIGSALRGELYPDELAYLQDNAASFGVSSGVGGFDPTGTNFSGYRGLRNLGLSSDKRRAEGEQMLTNRLATLPRTQLFNPATNFTTTDQQQTTNQLRNTLGSAPIPQDAQNRALQLANAGVAAGRGAGGGSSGTQPSIIDNLLRRFGGGTGGGSRGGYVPPNPTAGTGSFDGSSAVATSYNPDKWANWEDEMWGGGATPPNTGFDDLGFDFSTYA
jgi:hypothetical protein